MARKSVPKTDHAPESFRKSIVEGIERLWEKHGAFALEFAEGSDKQKVSVSFPVEIDLSKSEPVTSVGIGFSQRVTDEVVFTLDDPDQGTFSELMESKPEGKGPNKGESEEPRDGEQEAEKPKKRGKAKSE